MPERPRSVADLERVRRRTPSWLVDLTQPEVGGGRTTTEALATIDDHPRATAVRVSGLDQPTFERLVTHHGSRLTALELWKCPLVSDLDPLADLPGLRHVSIFWNQRATQLWDLDRTPALVGLALRDFTRCRRLDGLDAGSSLLELSIGDAVWPAWELDSLDPLTRLTGLRHLNLSPKKVRDDRIQPIGALSSLESLRLPFNLFSTEQHAWLRAHLPPTVRSEALAPTYRSAPAGGVGLVGRRKPTLHARRDADRVRRHVTDFEAMVERFRADPGLGPG